MNKSYLVAAEDHSFKEGSFAYVYHRWAEVTLSSDPPSLVRTCLPPATTV
jgi:hypothetical protein